MHVRLFFFAVLFAIALSAVAQAPAAAPDHAAAVRTAFARAQHLKRGINASIWFAQSPGDYSAARTNRFTDAADIALIARLGFDNVRISIDAPPLEKEPLGLDGLNDDFVGRLDKAVDTALADGLAVQIDLHPDGSYKEKLITSDDAVDRLARLWRHLAAHYASRDPERIFFEILNEPGLNDRYRWAGIQARLAAAIRESAPQQTIIAAGAEGSGIPDLLSLQPLNDGNVIYNFHYYEPTQFTHQGASWSAAWWTSTHGIPYPPTEDGMQQYLNLVPDLADRYDLEQYWAQHWDEHHIRMLIDQAAAWQRKNHVPLICNEFGVFRDHSDPVSRANWIRDVRTVLESDGIGWAMWDYRDNFGLVYKQDGQPARVDEGVLAALGLKR
ncbi:MAG: glycoside hydrolase family 5 protein [Terracidiphilus sp.]|jgi:aryl-phospho-beta-D-glucosidase BglC (GH1 family)